MGQYILKTAFNKGELSPLVGARRELDLYQAGLETCLNWTVLKHGGVRRRSGTRYMGSSKEGDRTCALIPYIFNTGQSFILEFGHHYIRFWMDGGLILSGMSPYEVVTTYDETEVQNIQFAVANDVIYLAHPSHKPAKLQRLGNTNWTLTDVAFRDGPYMPLNDIAANTLTPSGGNLTTGASRTLTWAAGVNLTNADIGRKVRFQNTTYVWATITAVSSALVATATIDSGAGQAAAATTTWQLGAFGTTPGYPACVEFFEGRLIWGRTTAQPRAIFASYSGIPERYSPTKDDATVTDAHGFALDTVSGQADPILWLKESKRLQMGTASAIRSIGSTDGSEVMAQRNVTSRLEVGGGAADVRPASVGPSTMFAGRAGLTLRDLIYDGNAQSLVSPELSAVSEHLFKKKIKKLAYQAVPDSILWALLEDGSLVGLTTDRDEKVVGFHRHELLDATVEDIACIPSADRDELYLLVHRFIFEEDVRYLEKLEPSFDGDLVEAEDAFFVDCGATYEGSPVSTVTGLEHLRLVEVDILADGAPLPRATVDGDGELVLPNNKSASTIHVGIPIANKCVTLPTPAQANDGSAFGRVLRAVSAVIDVLETSGLEAGQKDGNLVPIRLRRPSNHMGKALPLVSGEYDVPIQSGWIKRGQIEFSCPQPLPATVLAINLNVDAQ